MDSDLFLLLGVTPDCTDKELKKAYKKKALEYHPDKNIGVDTNELFNKVRHAFEVLSDPNLRETYRQQSIAQGDREKRYAMQSKEIRRFREELLKREREHMNRKKAENMSGKQKVGNIGKKREREQEREREREREREDDVRSKFGRNTVRLDWKDDTAYTDLMIAQILNHYGPIKKIQLSQGNKFAYVEFEHHFSAVTVIRERIQRNPPEEFSTRFLNIQEYSDLNKQKVMQNDVSTGIDSDSSILAHRMKRFLEKVKQSNL